MPLPVAILAGGLATRLYPLTHHLPKSLLQVGAYPFIIHQLRYLSQQGIKKVVLCIGHYGEQIQAVVGDGKALGLEVLYSHDGPQPLGTGGAIKNALPLLDKAFFVLYGDSYLPIHFGAVAQSFQQAKQDALLTVFKNKNQWDSSNVLFQNNHILAYSKKKPFSEMEHIDYGLSILSAQIFQPWSASKAFDLDLLYEKLAEKKQLQGYEVFSRFYEIGSLKGLQEAREMLQ